MDSDGTLPAESAPLPLLEGRPTLARWMRGAGAHHPLLGLASPEGRAASNPMQAQTLDAMENLLSVLESDDASRWRKKRENDFPALISHSQLLDLRAELLVARALAESNVSYQLGNTKVSNPDFVVPDHDLGVEVTAKAPPSISSLHEQVEGLLRDWPGVGVQLTFSLYPSRLTGQQVDELVQKVTIAARDVCQSGSTVTIRQKVDDPKNVKPIMIEAVLRPLSAGALEGRVWSQVEAGLLEDPLSSAEYAVFEIGASSAKAKQARSISGGVILAIDLSRYGAAWMRPGAVWAGRLAQRFTSDFPFAAIAIFRQDLRLPHIIEPAVGISSYAAPDTRRRIEQLCEILAWPHAIASTNGEA
ncbi:hypothetical protein OG320_16485 [Microbispora sp. NBC_01189]|uniref:hypothetical protein n=1 Tax=Microbispora sp. NBC_01189 TaxID=2903583 RepID=UPI002E0F69B6|nr:hypothetical protein OG320_16485 [Microbispora sp. NBC_01189]